MEPKCPTCLEKRVVMPYTTEPTVGGVMVNVAWLEGNGLPAPPLTIKAIACPEYGGEG